jgi:hypothetical protein
MPKLEVLLNLSAANTLETITSIPIVFSDLSSIPIVDIIESTQFPTLLA